MNQGMKESAFTDPRDKQKYKTVEINGLVWMAENFRYGIEEVVNLDKKNLIKKNKIEVECFEFEVRKYYEKYGGLYDWETAKKLAPKDWRLPTVDDWNNLIQYVGGWRNAGQKLKSDGSNSSGFSAIEGHYPEIGLALKKSICGYSWWSMERDNTLAFIQFFDCDDVFQTYQDKSLHCSVRYVQDQHDSFGTKVKGEHAVVLNGLHIY